MKYCFFSQINDVNIRESYVFLKIGKIRNEKNTVFCLVDLV